MSTFEFLPQALLLMRRLKDLSQREAAERAGMKPPQLSGYENGTVQPELPQLDRLLRAYDADLFDLATTLAAIRVPHRALAAAARADEVRESHGRTLLLREGGMLVPHSAYKFAIEFADQFGRVLQTVEEIELGRTLRQSPGEAEQQEREGGGSTESEPPA